jgi:CBS domain-containing protein
MINRRAPVGAVRRVDAGFIRPGLWSVLVPRLRAARHPGDRAMSVQSIMTPNPVCCTTSTSLQEVAKLMLDNDCGQIPVVAGNGSNKPIGVVTDRDIVIRLVAQGTDASKAQAGDAMSTPCVTVSCDTSLRECCDIMESNQIRRVPVVDKDGELCGIVALADIALSGQDARTVEVVKEVSATAH